MKKLICALSLLSSAAFAAAGTMVVTQDGNQVQCNGWGWTQDLMTRTYWADVTCAPLEVKTRNGDVLSVANTDVCNGEGIAVYTYNEGDSEVSFNQCL